MGPITPHRVKAFPILLIAAIEETLSLTARRFLKGEIFLDLANIGRWPLARLNKQRHAGVLCVITSSGETCVKEHIVPPVFNGSMDDR